MLKGHRLVYRRMAVCLSAAGQQTTVTATAPPHDVVVVQFASRPEAVAVVVVGATSFLEELRAPDGEEKALLSSSVCNGPARCLIWRSATLREAIQSDSR